MTTNKTEKLPVIFFDDMHDKILAEQLICPICGDKYIHHVPYVQVPCGKCGNTYRTDFKQDIYTKNARRINSTLAWNNGVMIIAAEKYEGEIIHIKEHYLKMNSWDLSDITKKEDEHKRCNRCGVCLECFTCKGCGKTFNKDKNRKKQMCPHCKSDKFTRT